MVQANCLIIAAVAITTLLFSVSIISVQTERSSLQAERESLQRERDSVRDELILLRNAIGKLQNNINNNQNRPDKGNNGVDLDFLTKHVTETVIKETNALKPYIEKNRETLKKVPKWIEDTVYYNSIFQYGLPEYVKPLIDNPLSSDPTYTDVMIFIGDKYFPKRKNYLEIGVSVGKNIFQMVNAFQESSICIYELENINPTLENLFTDPKTIELWNIDSTLRKTAKFVEYKYSPTNSVMKYLTSDVYDEGSWSRYDGTKFDMIFSDGLHSPDAIKYEMDMLIKGKLFNEDHFVLWYDDMGGDMTQAFYKNFLHLKETLFPSLNENNIALVKVNGWLGSGEGKHLNGIISNLNIRDILKEAQEQ